MTYKFTIDKVGKCILKNFRGIYGNENIIIGNHDSADFREIKRAVKRDTTKTYLDLG